MDPDDTAYRMTAPTFRVVKRRDHDYRVLRLHGYRTDGRPSYRSEPVGFWFYTRERAEDWVQHHLTRTQEDPMDADAICRTGGRSGRSATRR